MEDRGVVRRNPFLHLPVRLSTDRHTPFRIGMEKRTRPTVACGPGPASSLFPHVLMGQGGRAWIK